MKLAGADWTIIWNLLTACIIPLGIWLVRIQSKVEGKADDTAIDILRDRITTLEANKADRCEVTMILTEVATLRERLDNNTKMTDKVDSKLDLLLDRVKGQS